MNNFYQPYDDGRGRNYYGSYQQEQYDFDPQSRKLCSYSDENGELVIRNHCKEASELGREKVLELIQKTFTNKDWNIFLRWLNEQGVNEYTATQNQVCEFVGKVLCGMQ